MSWLSKSDWEEWLQDPLVMRLRDKVAADRAQALKRLRTAARTALDLATVRAAQERVTCMDEFMAYLSDEQDSEDD